MNPSSSAHQHPPVSSDEEDVRSAVAGDRQAFDRLVLRHQQAVLNTAYYCLGHYQDALEVAQETFLKAYRSLAGFRSQSSFRTWIVRIAVNTARSLHSRMRAKKRSGQHISLSPEGRGEDGPAVDVPDGQSGPDALLARKEVKEALEDAISALDGDSREIIVLRDINGESYESISQALDLPLGTVKSRVHRARLQLREHMMKYL